MIEQPTAFPSHEIRRTDFTVQGPGPIYVGACCVGFGVHVDAYPRGATGISNTGLSLVRIGADIDAGWEGGVDLSLAGDLLVPNVWWVGPL